LIRGEAAIRLDERVMYNEVAKPAPSGAGFAVCWNVINSLFQKIPLNFF
jgi:hypothetical protein